MPVNAPDWAFKAEESMANTSLKDVNSRLLPTWGQQEKWGEEDQPKKWEEDQEGQLWWLHLQGRIAFYQA